MVEIGFEIGFWVLVGVLLWWVAVAALGLCFSGVLLWWYRGGTGWGWAFVSVVFCCGGAVASLGGAGFVFRWYFVVVLLWRR